MNVLYTCDDNYVWLMGISMISLFDNNKELKDLDVYLLGENISEEHRQCLHSISNQYNRKITLINVPKLDIPESLVSARWPLSAFARLFCGNLLPIDMKRILYLDCDTIIKGGIIELETIDFGGNVAMSVKDCVGKRYKMNIGLENDVPYFNAGVILFNLDVLRTYNIKQTIDQYMLRYVRLVNYADQDIFNGIFNGHIGVLNAKYNVMTIASVYSCCEIETLRKPTNFYTDEELKEAVQAPTIIHYTTNMKVVRPWYSNTDHPFAPDFLYYMNMSPWKNKQLERMVFRTKESKIIGAIQKLPKGMANWTLGLIHATLKPIFIRARAGK